MFNTTSQSQSTTTTPPALFQTYILPSRPFRRRQTSLVSPISSPTFDYSSPTSPITPGTSYSTSFSPTSPIHQSPRRPSYLSGHTTQLSCARCKASLALSSQIISKGFTGRHGRALLVSPSPVDTDMLPAPRSRRASRAFSTSTSSGLGGTELPLRARRPSTVAREQDERQAPRTRRTSSLTAALFSTISSSFSSSSPSSPIPDLLAATTLPNTQVHRPVQRHLVTGLHTVSDVSCMVCGSMLGWKYIAAEEAAQRYKVGKYILEVNRIVGEVAWDGECEETAEWEDGEDGAGGVFSFEEEEEEEAVHDAGVSTSGGSRDGRRNTFGPEIEATSTTEMSISPTSISTSNLARNRSTSIRFIDAPRPLPSHNRQPIVPRTYPQEEDDEDVSASDEDDSYSDTSSPNDNAIDDDDDEDILFDSQDEDECDDLFAGVWSPALAKERRKSRGSRRGSGR